MTDTPAQHYQKAIQAMRPAIEALYRQYDGFSEQWVDAEDMPASELEPFLANIDLKFPDSTHRRLKLAIWEYIQRLACFKYRVLCTTDDGVYVWNPLEKPLRDWLHEHRGGQITYRGTDQPYPATDLIADWIVRQLHEPLALD